MESVTWAQLGLHDKRCGILNVDGFFDHLLSFLAHAVAQGFIKERPVAGLIVEDDVDALLDAVVGAASGQVAASYRLGRSRTSRSSSSPSQSVRRSAADA
jgi:predicted Rossmann-fold nucleotide-binding protein